ncbi:MAG: hypothetical protein L0Z55_02090 [Planctomycetes bacterium]|nr:hypothetical protein [Planctomycetota bacterium]
MIGSIKPLELSFQVLIFLMNGVASGFVMAYCGSRIPSLRLSRPVLAGVLAMGTAYLFQLSMLFLGLVLGNLAINGYEKSAVAILRLYQPVYFYAPFPDIPIYLAAFAVLRVRNRFEIENKMTAAHSALLALVVTAVAYAGSRVMGIYRFLEMK